MNVSWQQQSHHRADGMTAGNFSKGSRPRQRHGRVKRGKGPWSSWDGLELAAMNQEGSGRGRRLRKGRG